MKHILSRPSAEVLARFACPGTMLAFDFDGTLAPIVPDRDRAHMRAATRALFARVCRLYPCIVISGRRMQDVRRRLDGAEVRHVIGNHGLEPSPDMKRFERQMAAVRPPLEAALRVTEGVELEDKRYSLALHYRGAANRAKARNAIHTAVAQLAVPMRIVAGKLVVNVVPPSAPHKGDALLHLWQAEGAARALFVGDDKTDEDIFRIGRSERLLAIRVGRSRSSAAPYYLRNQREIDPLLARLADLPSGA